MTYVRSIVYGLVISFLVIVISSLLLAVYLKFSSLSESTFTYVTFALGNIAYFCGGFFAGWKGKKRGWLLGLLTGLGLSIVMFIIQSMNASSVLSLELLAFHTSYIFFAIFGSIIGVNAWK